MNKETRALIIKVAVSWPMLAFQAALLAFISWPMADHWVSYFWLLVLFAVLLAEILNKLFSPKKQTVSNNIRDEAVSTSFWARVRFWAMIAVWLWFSATLAVHFMTKLF